MIFDPRKPDHEFQLQKLEKIEREAFFIEKGRYPSDDELADFKRKKAQDAEIKREAEAQRQAQIEKEEADKRRK